MSIWKKIKYIQSYEYASQSWKQFLLNRLIAFAGDATWGLFLLLCCLLLVLFVPR